MNSSKFIALAIAIVLVDTWKPISCFSASTLRDRLHRTRHAKQPQYVPANSLCAAANGVSPGVGPGAVLPQFATSTQNCANVQGALMQEGNASFDGPIQNAAPCGNAQGYICQNFVPPQNGARLQPYTNGVNQNGFTPQIASNQYGQQVAGNGPSIGNAQDCQSYNGGNVPYPSNGGNNVVSNMPNPNSIGNGGINYDYASHGAYVTGNNGVVQPMPLNVRGNNDHGRIENQNPITVSDAVHKVDQWIAEQK